MNTKKIAASVVGVMLLATVLAMAVSAAGMDRRDYANDPRMVYEFDAADDTGIYINDYFIDDYYPNDGTVTASVLQDGRWVPTVRIYGEKDAIYPTQSYTGEHDFIYPDPVDPFDPGVIGKDSATLNSAYIDNMYEYASECWSPEIIVNGCDGDEKVFLRLFYEPGYYHARDLIMSDYYNSLEPVSMPNGALVTETTYMLLEDNDNNGHAGDPKLGGINGTMATRFMLPVSSSNPMDDTPGMDVGDMVDLIYADAGSTYITEGTIEVEQTYDVSFGNALYLTDVASFMDHGLVVLNIDHDDEVTLGVGYLGNMDLYHAGSTGTVTMNEGDKLYFNRINGKSTDTNPAYRWFIEVIEVYYNEFHPELSYAELNLGRRLVAGETFYVDGVRYDMPAIYVAEDGGVDKFKYITFQSPIPKCPILWNPPNMADESHVTSQWLANLDEEMIVWVLPPFNDPHLMIDDIGIPKEGSCVKIYSEAGNILDEVPALEFYYVKEWKEERFDTSIAERHARKDGVELWNWWSVFTKPYQYTELYLPDQEVDDDYVDGYEYLITTSFIAPNCEGEERAKLCKSDREVHDIIDRAADIAKPGDNSRDKYADMPRVAFEFDAFNDEDLFVNGDGSGEDTTVRVYGEANAIYPTHSFTDEDDFIYPNHVDPFDPGIIGKDSVTFNPAYINNMYEHASEWWSPEIIVDGCDGDEKIFLRLFYEPGYHHARDKIMSDYYSSLESVSMSRGAIVTETTYMLLDDNDDSGHAGLPKLGGIDGTTATRFMLPVSSSDLEDDTPGMDVGDMVDLIYAKAGSIITAGTIEVEQTYDISCANALYLGDAVSFMDHGLAVLNIDHGDEVTLGVGYLGNMDFYHAGSTGTVTMNEGDKLYFNRINGKSTDTNPAYRWFIAVTEVYYNEFHPGMSYAELKLGRRLVAGETFYVDGVRYDMPAIYVAEDGGVDKFKYITFQSPIPKCPTLWNPPSMADESHVTSQYLANVWEGMTVWVLPPFNQDHTMIDDIGLEKISCGSPKKTISVAGNILGDVSALDFHYVEESTEGRFDTSLAERHAYDGYDEIWNWWSIFTKPYQYTELWLPDQENTTAFKNVDGNEYLITTSFIAPNCEDAERTELCKSDREVHDIIDRASELNGTIWQEPPCGDVTGDYNVNMGDVTLLLNHVSYPGDSTYDILSDEVGDVTGDGNVNMGDVTLLLNHVSYPGDSTYDLNCV
jgi:hypothetical protein